jgi:hypothetical protein
MSFGGGGKWRGECRPVSGKQGVYLVQRPAVVIDPSLH